MSKSKYVEALLCNLSVREDSTYESSNFSQYLYLLGKELLTVDSTDGEITISKDNNKIYFHLPESFKMKDLLAKVNEFFDSQVKDYVKVTEAQLKDVSFLKSFELNDNIRALIQALEVSETLSKSLDTKSDHVLNSDDVKNMEFIGTLPLYVIGFAMRVNVGLTKLIQFNLDEYSFFGEVTALNELGRKVN